MSIMRFVFSLANTSTEPPVPAGTTAAFAITVATKPFSVEAFGRGWPVGHTVRKVRNPGGTTVTLKEYACAVDGIEQSVLDCIGKVRGTPPRRPGGPNGPVNPEPVRVSTTRQGVIATKIRGLLTEVAPTSAAKAEKNFLSTLLGCHRNGADQGFSGTRSR